MTARPARGTGISRRQSTPAKVRDTVLVAVIVTLMVATTLAAGPASQSSRPFAQLIDQVVAVPGSSSSSHRDGPKGP